MLLHKLKWAFHKQKAKCGRFGELCRIFTRQIFNRTPIFTHTHTHMRPICQINQYSRYYWVRVRMCVRMCARLLCTFTSSDFFFASICDTFQLYCAVVWTFCVCLTVYIKLTYTGLIKWNCNTLLNEIAAVPFNVWNTQVALSRLCLCNQPNL